MKHVGQAIIKESSTEHQAAHVENENSDDSFLDQSIRKDHNMSDGYEDDGNIDDCDDKSDEDEEEERNPNFLVPTYINQPDPDDLCAIRRIQSGKQKSVFYQHISKVEKNLKSDWNWPLQPFYDMVRKLYAVTH